MKFSLSFPCIVLCIIIANSAFSIEIDSLNSAEKTKDQYLKSFGETGVPTPRAVRAQFSEASKLNTIESWEKAAKIANAYANVVEIIKDHYSDLYRYEKASRGNPREFLSKAADYETMQNTYLRKRNKAYFEMAKLYFSKGNLASALSYVIIVIQTSTTEHQTEGLNLMKRVIEFEE